MTTSKKTYFYRIFGPFAFCLCFFFLFLFLQHKKDENKKCNFLFENLIFDIPKILQKHYFDTMWHYLRFQKCPKNIIKMGETVKKKLGPVLTLKPPNLGPVFNFTAYIYVYIYICAVELKAGPRCGVSWVKNSEGRRPGVRFFQALHRTKRLFS